MPETFKTLTPSIMNREDFVAAFADIYEHSPWVAERSFAKGITENHNHIDAMAALMAETMLEADRDAQRKLIIAHPDLAGRAAIKGELTAASSREQTGAGLDQCSLEEMQKFQKHNAAYKEKFGFPFIIAVTGLNRHIILQAFKTRLKNSREEEFQTALTQINKIAKIRLNQL